MPFCRVRDDLQTIIIRIEEVDAALAAGSEAVVGSVVALVFAAVALRFASRINVRTRPQRRARSA
jgi:hypothetical protein